MNVWKSLFAILLSINILFIIWVTITFSNSYDLPDEKNGNYNTAESGIELKMTNQSVQSILNDVIDDDSIQISVGEAGIYFKAVQSVLGIDVETSLNLEPVSIGEELVFAVKDIDVADLPLTQDMFYSIIKNQSDLPEGIRFDEDERALLINIKALTQDFKMEVEVEKIDYRNDEWYFSIIND
ncbi:hypothetical protein GCM10022378_14890 [Salinicoccus jeotgali]|uniref:DUF2140 domain-containing protein n=1 Tax=Salinicoccus jeotgali TaxID=381634 RepID=A0ABP7EX59_9STAP